MSSQYTPVREVTIDQALAGQRLDNFLFRQFRDLPKSRIYKMLRKGEVRVNGARAKQQYRVQAGDRLRLPPVWRENNADNPINAPTHVKQSLEKQIIFENPDLLVINKPSGIAVHGGSGLAYGGVIETLRAMRPDVAFLELAHRLDRDTSGCLILGKNREALLAVHDLLRSGRINKHYLALVAGAWQGGKRHVEQHLSRRAGQKSKPAPEQSGKLAISDFTPLQHYDNVTLMQVNIHTGRTHQIRVQSAELGYPIIGDDKYGDFALNRQWRKKGLKRLFLHAKSISFNWPENGQEMRFEAPLANDLQRVMDQLNEK